MVYEEEMVKCPLNEAHTCKRMSLQRHIIKCMKTYTGTKLRCPYNAIEYIEKSKFDEHVLNCPSKIPSGFNIFNDFSNNQHVTNPPIKTSTVTCVTDEEWE